MVAPHHLATAAGLGILRAGGHAVDAAIAANAVLAVVFGEACGLGGDAFWLVWDETAGSQVALNGSGRAPAGADPAALRARGLATLPFRGPLSITVPGAVRSWADAHARFGRLSWPALLAPAIELAEGGFPADELFVRAVEGSAAVFESVLGDGARGWSAVYRPHDRAWRPGERVILPALAATLERLAVHGADDFYGGELAARQAAGLAVAGSTISAADLAAHTSTWETPLALEYRTATATTHPPNSSGVVALEILNVLRAFEPPERAAFAPAGRGATAGRTSAGRTSGSRQPSAPWPTATPTCPIPPSWTFPWPGSSTPPTGGAGPPHRSRPCLCPAPARAPIGGGTIWLGVVDGAGNAVSLIESNYAGFGSGVVDPATGIAYQNRGSYFSPGARPPQRPRVGQADAPHAAARDALPGRAALGRPREHGRRRPARRLRPGGLALVDGEVDVATAVATRPLVAGAPGALRAPPSWSRSSRVSGPACWRGSRRWVIASMSGRPSTEPSATATRSSWSRGGRPPEGRSRRRPIRARRGSRRRGDLATW